METFFVMTEIPYLNHSEITRFSIIEKGSFNFPMSEKVIIIPILEYFHAISAYTLQFNQFLDTQFGRKLDATKKIGIFKEFGKEKRLIL